MCVQINNNDILTIDRVRASSENRGNLARYAADGNLSTFWAPDSPDYIERPAERVQKSFLHWLEIDLGRVETVHAVTLKSGLGCLDDDNPYPHFSGFQVRSGMLALNIP